MAGQIVVLGAGLAGLAAALYARKNGADVQIISEEYGTTALSSGSFVMRDTEPTSAPITQEAATLLAELLPDWQVLPEPKMIPNVHGTTTPIVVAAPWHQNALLGQTTQAPILLVGLYECVQFWAEFAANGLNRIFGPELEFRGARLEPFGIENPNPLAIAQWLDNPQNRQVLVEQVSNLIKNENAQTLLFPPVLGTTLDAFQKFVQSFEGVQIAELWAAWGAGGLRTLSIARQAAQNAGINFVNSRIQGIKLDNKQAVAIETANGTVDINGAVIFAIGGTLLAAREFGVEHFRPPVDLPWGTTEDSWVLKDPNRLFAQEIDSYHPALSIGVNIDERYRILTELGELWAENCFACGDVLSGAYPARGGLAFAITSGIAAAKQALQALE